jgi:hypothetical protein
MLVLFETPVGYALFQINDEKKFKKPEDIASIFQSTEKTKKLYKLLTLESLSMLSKNSKIMLQLLNHSALS